MEHFTIFQDFYRVIAEMTEEEARSIYSTMNGIKKLLVASSTWNDLPLEANA